METLGGGGRSLNKLDGGEGHMYTQREIISFVFKQYIGINYLQKLKMHQGQEMYATYKTLNQQNCL